MKEDDILAEVRANREAYAKQFNYDLQAIYQDLKRKQAESKRTVVAATPNRIYPIEEREVETPA